MKIGLRAGHSPNCKGAMGYVDEQVEVKKIYDAVAPMLVAAGHTVVNCNTTASTVQSDLDTGTNIANAAGCDIFIAIHMNATVGGYGTEVWLYDNKSQVTMDIAKRVCANFAEKGFRNRGVKFNTGLHDLRCPVMPSMIIESLFVDSIDDVNRYKKLGVNQVAAMIASAITGTTIKPSSGSTSTSKPATSTPSKPATSTTAKPSINVAVKTARHGILAAVSDRKDYAGWEESDVVAVKIGVTSGRVEYRAHLLGKGWLPKVSGCDWNDYNNGYAGDDKTPIDAIQVYYYTDTSKTGGKYYSAVYQVKGKGQKTYFDNVSDTNWENNDGDNTAGCFGMPITRILMSLE